MTINEQRQAHIHDSDTAYDGWCASCPEPVIPPWTRLSYWLRPYAHRSGTHLIHRGAHGGDPTRWRVTARPAAPSVSTDIDKRGEQYIEKRLAEAASEVEGIERRLTGARFRRDALIAKLLAAGASERHIAEIAKVSGPRVHQIKEASRG